jgi:hypothetical protein
MNDLIVCPHCKKSFSPDEVFTHQLDEKRRDIEEKAKKQLEDFKSDFATRKESELRKRIAEEQELKLKDSKKII